METATAQQIHFYTPSALINVVSNSINIGETKKMISLRGVYIPGKGQSYSDYYYDTLKDEASDFQMTLIVPGLLRAKLSADKVIEFSGYISKRLGSTRGSIEIQANLSQIHSQTHNQFSEEEIKSLEIQQKKSIIGFRDVEAHLKAKIVKNEKINVVIVVGRTNIIHDDIKGQMKEAVGFYDIEFHPVNLYAQSEIENAISLYNKPGIDILAIARGGGDNLEIFNKPAIAEKTIGLAPLFVTAIGHKQDVTLLQKMADKSFITPTAFGQYLREIYDNTKAELQNSKAKLIDDITLQLKTNYDKQLQNLQEQLKSTGELNMKTIGEARKNYEGQLQNLQIKLKGFEELAIKTNQEKSTIHFTEVNNLKKHIDEITAIHKSQVEQATQFQADKNKAVNDQILSLMNQQKQKDQLIIQANNQADSYQQQLREAKENSGPGIAFIVIAVIVGLIVGFLLANKS